MQEPDTRPPSRTRRLMVGGGVTLVAMLAMVPFTDQRQLGQAQSATPPAGVDGRPVALPDSELARAEGLSRAFRAAAQNVLPAAVVIKVGASPLCPRCGRAHELDEGEAGTPDNMGHSRALHVLGSGFIVTPTGTILTNKHVVGASRRLVVQTADGKQFPVKQVETDQEHDVAVLKIDSPVPERLR